MSEQEAPLNELDKSGNHSKQEWRSVTLGEVAWKRSENVDPNEVDLDRHVGLEHIESNKPRPSWEQVDGLSSAKRRFEAGDILFAKLRPNLEKAAQPDFEGIASTDIFPIVAEDDVNAKYLLYRLSSKPAFDHARRTSVGTRMPRTSWNLFTNFQFELPTLEEQRRIASVLHTVDQAIKVEKELASQTRQVKSALMSTLFTGGYYDHDVYKGNGWRCKAKKIPEQWDIDSADDLMTIRRGASPRPRSDDSLFGGDIPWIKIGDADRETSQSIDCVESHVTEKGKAKSEFVTEGSLLVANSGATCGFAIFAGLDGCVHDGWLILEDYEGFDKKYLYHYINWNYEYLRSLSLGSAQTNLSTYLFGRLDIPKPPMNEQQKIADCLDSLDGQRSQYRKEKERLDHLKKGLIQDLLSGEVRTHDKNIDIVDEVLEHG